MMEWPVSEDNQWRQLGSLVNAVLLDTRSKAVRAGTVSKPAPGRSLKDCAASNPGRERLWKWLSREEGASPCRPCAA